MKTLLDRGTAALKLRREREKAGLAVGSCQGLEGLEGQLGTSRSVARVPPATATMSWKRCGTMLQSRR